MLFPTLVADTADDGSPVVSDRVVDHRPAGWGTLDGEGFIRTIRGLVELTPDVRLCLVAVPRLTDAGMVARMRASGNNETGGEFEIEWYSIWTFGGGQIRRAEQFPLDDVAAALARLESLVAPDQRRGR